MPQGLSYVGHGVVQESQGYNPSTGESRTRNLNMGDGGRGRERWAKGAEGSGEMCGCAIHVALTNGSLNRRFPTSPSSAIDEPTCD